MSTATIVPPPPARSGGLRHRLVATLLTTGRGSPLLLGASIMPGRGTAVLRGPADLRRPFDFNSAQSIA